MSPRTEDHDTTTVDAAAAVARIHAERDNDDHGPSCRCGACLEALR